MLNERNVCKRVVAIVLVFIFALSNCFTLLSTVSLAEVNELGRQQSSSFSDNVEYTVNFEKDEEKCGYEFEGAIDEENLAIKIQIAVKKEGYLKNAKILIESEGGLSFNINRESENGYQIEGNQIMLSNITADEKQEIILPITYKQREDINNLNKKINVKLIGIYVKNSGKEQSISEDYVLRLKWNTNTEFNVTSEVKKYIPYSSANSKGIILQTSVKSWIPSDNNFVQKEKFDIETININGYKLSKIIVANKSGENLDESSWNYDEEENKLHIKLENNLEAIESEEFLITYILTGNKEIELPCTLTSEINAKIFMFGNEEEIETNLDAEYEIEESIGEIISINGQSTESIKLGNLLANSLSEENQYKTNYETKITADISSTDMIEGILIRNAEIEFEDNDSKYDAKSIIESVRISKENFDKILGQDGRIEILNDGNEVISQINKDTKLENDEYIAEIENENITIKTTKPQEEGTLSIIVNSEIQNQEYSYETLKLFSKLNVKYTGSVLYEENIENKISDIVNKVELVKPETKAQLEISKDVFSTIEDNDTEIKINLNNISEDIDLYRNPKFEIVFPEYIDDVNVSNIAIANSENVFEIADSRIYKNSEDRIILNIDLSGEQTRYNTNTFTNGTSILINAKIKLNLYTPSTKKKIELHYTNDNVTAYEIEESGKGYSEAEVSYKAPVGVVSINKISNYDSTGRTVTSVEQGKVTDKIEIFADSKIATMDIIVMNNNENSCDNVKILGRIPFKGNKDVTTGEDLGTTIDCKLVSNIIEAENNLAKATIYYSEKAEATEDLSLQENEWSTNAQDLSKIKSYLIIVDNYKMEPGQILKYTYKYEIPGNLEHNTDIYGSFKTMFNNLSEIAIVKEVSSADIVGLTTGVGPQLAVETTSNVTDKVKEYEKIKYTIKIENTGSEVAKNVVVNTTIPKYATHVVYTIGSTAEEYNGWELKQDKEIKTTIEKINPGEIKKVEIYVQANKLPTIEEYYADDERFTKNEVGKYCLQKAYVTEDGETKYVEEEINGLPEINLVCESNVTATDLEKKINTESEKIKVQKSNIIAEEVIESDEDISRVNKTIKSKIRIKNNSQEKMTNVVVSKQLPLELKYSDSYIRGYEEDGITLRKIRNTDYNQDSRVVTWTIDELEPGRSALVIGEWVVGEMEDKVYKKTISTTTTINVKEEQYQAGQVDITIGRPYLEISQVSNKTNQYVKVGDIIEYTFTIKNVGAVRAESVTLIDNLPEAVSIKELKYNVDGVEVSKTVAQNEDAVVYTTIVPEGKMEAKVTAVVNDIDRPQKMISNVGNLEATNVDKVKSNEVINIVERPAESVAEAKPQSINKIKESKQENSKGESSQDQNFKEKYEIKGIVWVDENKNGSREKQEKVLSGIQVRLMNQKTGEQIEKNVTNSDGEYEFRNLANGTYMVIFDYNSSKYSLTEYKKQNVADNLNSDVINASDGNKTVAATDTIIIKDGSKSNIDAGLIQAATFDLSLTKRVNIITVQTSNGTNTYNFNNADLAKVDINGKYINGAKVLIEYSFIIKNEGEIEGYAKEIVDYMPKELEFSSDLNADWYKGNDGNIYTEQLANTPIPSGQTKTIQLVLTRQMTESSTGIINNEAEISKDYNKLGVADIDSDPNDRDQKDDDISSADVIIGVKTGDTLIYISAIIAGIISAIAVAVVFKKSKIIYKLMLKFGREV